MRSCESCGAPTGRASWALCRRCWCARLDLARAERAFAHGFAAGLEVAGRDPEAPAAREALRARLAALREEVARVG